jgi:protein ImuB
MPAAEYLCLHLRDFAAQTLTRLEPGLRQRPVAVLRGDPPLETVFALNQRARNLGLESGMSRLQAESFDGIFTSSRIKKREDSA